MNPRWLKHDVAYGCFLLWALTLLFLALLNASFTDAERGEGAGAIVLLFLPFLGVAFIAMLVGIVLSIGLWKHWPLLIIAGSSVLLITAYATQFGSTAFREVVPVAYGIGVAAMSGFWFLSLRRQHVPLLAVVESARSEYEEKLSIPPENPTAPGACRFCGEFTLENRGSERVRVCANCADKPGVKELLRRHQDTH